MPELRIDISAGLDYSTPIMCGDEIKTAGDIYLLQSGKPLETYALEGNSIVHSNIINIPKEVYTDIMYDISFLNGFHFQCTPDTKLLIYNKGYKAVKDINTTIDQVVNIFINSDGNINMNPIYITKCNNCIGALKKPVYLFATQHGNLLLPYYQKDKGTLSFTCVKQ